MMLSVTPVGVPTGLNRLMTGLKGITIQTRKDDGVIKSF
jgi:hypothetical protein